MDQGATIIPVVGGEPDAMDAPMSPGWWTTSASGSIARADV